MFRRIWVLFCTAMLPVALGAQELKLQVLATTDMHGHIEAQDSFTLQPANQGWAKIATLIRRQVALNGNTITLDCGDVIQGEPVNYVRTRLHSEYPEPSIAIMNALGYAAMAVGNHEYNWGLPALREAQAQAGFPFLSANTVDVATGKPAFATHVILNAKGARVAVVGFTTPWIPNWEEPENYAGLRFDDIVQTAKVLVPRLRTKEKADVVIVIMHSGLGAVNGRPGDENEALRLADQVPGIDLLLTGHTHLPIETSHNGVPILQAHAHGRALAVAELELRKSGSRWQVMSRAGRLLKPDADTPADPEVLALTEKIRALTNAYLDTFATRLDMEVDTRWSRIEDSGVMQLLHQVQRDAVGAQLSAASCNNNRIYIPKGPTSVRQWYALLPYENQVARIRVSGAQLRLYLEHAARYFNYSYEPELFNKAVPGFDYDMVDGVTYALDLTKPVGQRVMNLAWQGQPVKPDQSFTLAISTYRLRGGGGYMDAIGFHGRPELVNPMSQRNLFLQRVLSQPTLSVAPANNWRTIPYLDRERLLLQKPGAF